MTAEWTQLNFVGSIQRLHRRQSPTCIEGGTTSVATSVPRGQLGWTDHNKVSWVACTPANDETGSSINDFQATTCILTPSCLHSL